MPDSDSESSVDPDAPHLSPGCVIDYYAGISVVGDQRWLTRGVINEISGRGEEIQVTMDTGEVMGYMKQVCLVVDGQRTSNTFWSLEYCSVETGVVAVQAPNPNVSVVNNIRQGIRASLRHSGLSQFQDFLDSPAQSNNTQTSDDDSSSDNTHIEPSANTQVQSVQKSDGSSSSDNSDVETNPQFEQQCIPPVARQAQVRFDASLLVLFSNFIVMFASVVAVMICQSSQQLSIPDDVLKEMVEGLCGKRSLSDGITTSRKKRQMVKYDRARAFASVNTDWMSPRPIFDDKQFERTFRIKRSMVDYIIGHLAKTDRFWIQTRDAVGQLSIHPHVKFLAAQKLICYGVSFSAFKDYFQMGESTAALCVSHLCRGIVNCPAIADVYLRTPTKDDAKRIERLHHETHGIRGMLGSLDVTKVVWENCPAALKGQYQGKEKVATIGLEAVADHNLWIWHRAFGFPGTLNDINIWERSPLFQSMQDGSHSEIDFEFLINGETFTKLYYLVDGIYPTLARFLSTISDPTSKIASFFAVNQEAFRKDVERAFGVLKKKFLALKHPILYHHQDDIFFVVFASIAMHNMMVNYRIEEEGVLESEHFYAVSHLEDTELANQTDEQEEHDEVQQNECEGYNPSDPEDIDRKYRMVQKRWRELYDTEESKRLQVAVMNQLYIDHFGTEALADGYKMDENYNPLNY